MKRKIVLSSLLVAVTLSFSGCGMSQGNLSVKDPKKVAKIKLHQSTKNDVRNILGEPQGVSTKGDGSEVWTYNYVGADGSGMIKKGMAGYAISALIPGMGGVVGSLAATSTAGHNNSGVKSESRYLRLTFDSNGVLVDKEYSTTRS